MSEKMKCGLNPTNYLAKCPAIAKGLEPQCTHCQGCEYGVEAGIMGGWPNNKYLLDVAVTEEVE